MFVFFFYDRICKRKKKGFLERLGRARFKEGGFYFIFFLTMVPPTYADSDHSKLSPFFLLIYN
jgi:hypothetical protein